ncbi:hypothetical protein CVT24_007966 [Panaeolus cyanescens]|uniref:PH domain-containing protein n=1 Tax=Panaeolus cyanescens TaxID=181874 RepID=A0A409YQS7_9AGAR|nr:hypothetical protein CVT24_007966 [Panaeolus cyanescens]
MAIIENNNDYDLVQLWSIITELGEQLSQNRSMSVSLYSMAGKIKNQAVNSQTGFVLRRYNLDKSKEEYDAELENMNAAMTLENQGLQHDNKQLNALIKEYEQTLESLMSAFRNRAQDVQERELSLIREYEAKLLAREEENANKDLYASMAISNSLIRLSHLLRQVLRSQNGEQIESPTDIAEEHDTREPWIAAASADHALERDIELARLEKENEELRRLLGLLPPYPRKDSGSDFRPIFEAPHPLRLPSMQKLYTTIIDIGATVLAMSNGAQLTRLPNSTSPTTASFSRPTSPPLFPLRRGVVSQDRQSIHRGMKLSKNSDTTQQSNTLPPVARLKDKGKGKEPVRGDHVDNSSHYSREHYVPHYNGSGVYSDRNRPSTTSDPLNGRSKFRGSLLVAASDALGLKFGKRRPPSVRQAPTPIILPGVLEIGTFQDEELEERNRLREIAAHAIGLRPYVPSEETHSREDSSATEDEEEERTPIVRSTDTRILGYIPNSGSAPNIAGRSPHDSSLSITVPGSQNSTNGNGRYRSGSMIVSHSSNHTVPFAPIPPFPTTLSSLNAFRTSAVGLYPKYYPPSSLRIFALSKHWKTRFLVLTSPTTLLTRGRGPAVSYLHLFKSSNPDDKELERLEINENSVVFVAEEEVGGKKQVIKVGGVDVGAMRREYLHEEGGHTMWLLHISDSQDAQNWISNIKNSILGQRTVRAGLTPAHTSVSNEPRGDMDVMLSIRAQGLVTSPPPTTPTSPTRPTPTSPTLSTQNELKSNYASSISSQSARSHTSPIKQPTAVNAVSALKGLFNSTRPRSASRAASIDSERIQDRDTHEGSFASIGTNLLNIWRSGTPDTQTAVTVPSSPVTQHSAPFGGQIERRLDHRIVSDRPPIQWTSSESSVVNKDRANKTLSLGALSLQPPPRKRWTSVGPSNFPTMDVLPDDNQATITRTSYSLSRMSSDKAEVEVPPSPASGSFAFGSPEQRPRAPSLQSVSTYASGDQRVSFEQASVSTKRSSGTRSARRWSRHAALPTRTNAPTEPPPAVPAQIGVHPFAAEQHASPVSSQGSPHSFVSGLPTFSKRHSGSSALSFNSTSTHSHTVPNTNATAAANTLNPLSITIRPPSAHRVSMPPPRPAPTTALPPAPTDDVSATIISEPAPQPAKGSIRNSMVQRSFRIPIIAPKPPPSTTLPPRPDEITQTHRRSSSIGNGSAYPTILESIPASPVPALAITPKAVNPFPPPLGPLPPTPPTPPIPEKSIQATTKRSTSIKQRLRILSAPSGSQTAAKLQLPRPSTMVAFPNSFPTTSTPATPIAEKITLFQNDPSFLQMNTPTMDALTPSLTLFNQPPAPEVAEITSLSPPPRRGSKQLLDTDLESLSRRQHPVLEVQPEQPPQSLAIPDDQLLNTVGFTRHLSLSRPGSLQSLRTHQSETEPITETDVESPRDVSSLHDATDDKLNSPIDSHRHFSSRHGSVISLGIVSL